MMVEICMSETIGELAKALSKAQGEVKPAIKDSTNPFFRSKYADLASCYEACRAALAKNGLAVSQIMGIGDGGVPVTTILMHESGEWLAGTIALKSVKEDPQSMGSAITYARRYSLAAIVGIAPEDDDDGAAASGTASKDKASKSSPDTPIKMEVIPDPSGPQTPPRGVETPPGPRKTETGVMLASEAQQKLIWHKLSEKGLDDSVFYKLMGCKVNELAKIQVNNALEKIEKFDPEMSEGDIPL